MKIREDSGATGLEGNEPTPPPNAGVDFVCPTAAAVARSSGPFHLVQGGVCSKERSKTHMEASPTASSLITRDFERV